MPSRGEHIVDALDKAAESGMRAVEIVPSDCDGTSGFPETRQAVGFNLDRLDHALRDRLAEVCSRFDTVSVHSHSLDINLASHNEGIRRESVRQYRQCIEFAHAINAEWATFHPGHYVKRLSDDRLLRDRNIEFGKRAAELAERYELMVGYEEMGFAAGNHFEHLLDVIDRIGSPRFGLNFDIGHAWMLGSPHPYEWLRAFRGRIVEIHLHGAFHRPDRGVETHMPMEYEDCYDLAELFRKIVAVGFDGPMIFEIMSSGIDRYLEHAQSGKDLVCRLWDRAERTPETIQ